MWWFALAASLVLLWLALEAKTSRPDGDLVPVHPYRRLLFFISPKKSESVVLYDAYIDADPLLEWIAAEGEPIGAHITHAVVGAANKGLEENPHLNRFVAGGRLYQRRGRFVTFSMKRKKLDKTAKVAVVKLEMKDGEPFEELCRRMNGDIAENRSGKETATDREYKLFNVLPGFVLKAVAPVGMWLDARGLLPGFYLAAESLCASVVVANLGSLGMGAGYHHLYEWGNCPMFVMVGRVEERAVVVDGEVVARRQLHLRFTYDERIDDGLTAKGGIDTMCRVLANPGAELA